MAMTAMIPRRAGSRPHTRQGPPHQQLDQQPVVPTVGAQLAARMLALAGVTEAPSGISVPGARAFILNELGSGPLGAFIVGREFAHLHPAPDQSLHLTLPDRRAREVIQAGWAEYHPLGEQGHLPPTVVMLYAPRDQAEIEIVSGLLRESYLFARGQTAAADGEWPTLEADDRWREPMPD